MRPEVHTLAPGGRGGPLVVFAHGLEDSWTSWKLPVDQLDPACRALALDLPWRAGNDYRWRSRRPADWLRSGLDAVGTVPDVLVAHSFGATAALTLACADPAIADALVLVCPVYSAPTPAPTWDALDRSRASFVRNIQEGVRAQLGARTGTLDPDLLRMMTDLAVRRIGPAAFIAVYDEHLRSADLPLDRITRPVRVLAAAGDSSLGRSAAAALHDALPDGRVRVRPDLDHHCHVRRPEVVAAEVTGLLAAQGWRRASPAHPTGEAA